MKVAVTAFGRDLDSQTDPRFGRRAFFLVVEAGD
jgi:predicted Fe-Mo cluster-binding NifX family protein